MLELKYQRPARVLGLDMVAHIWVAVAVQLSQFVAWELGKLSGRGAP